MFVLLLSIIWRKERELMTSVSIVSEAPATVTKGSTRSLVRTRSFIRREGS